MLEAKDIGPVQIIYTKIAAKRLKQASGLIRQLPVNINMKWGIQGIHQQQTGAQLLLIFNLTTEITELNFEASITYNFNRPIDISEIKPFDAEKLLITRIADDLALFVAQTTSQMGTSPLIIQKGTIEKLIADAKRP